MTITSCLSMITSMSLELSRVLIPFLGFSMARKPIICRSFKADVVHILGNNILYELVVVCSTAKHVYVELDEVRLKEKNDVSSRGVATGA